MIRAALVLLTAALLAGCVTTPAPTLRPGLTATQVANPIRKPVGQTLRWRITIDGEEELPVSLILRSRSAGGGAIRLGGYAAVTLPAELPLGPDANNIAREISVLLTGTTEGLFFVGNELRLPAELTVDSRGRGQSARIFGLRASYKPHDCFAVIGECSFEAVGENGQRAQTTLVTTETDGIWRSDGRSSTGERVRSVYSLDRDGLMLDLVIISTENGQRSITKFERI